jgi:hypothetical protein
MWDFVMDKSGAGAGFLRELRFPLPIYIPSASPVIFTVRSITDQIFCIRQMLEKKWEFNETVHQLFVDFKKAYDSVKWEILYNILIEFGMPMKPVRLIKIRLN